MVEWQKLEKIDDFSSISSNSFGNNNWTDVGTWEPYIDTIRNEKNENL